MQFESIGQDGKFNLQDFKVSGDEADYVVQISVVNHIGVKLQTYVWTCTGGESGEESMWLNSDFEEMTEQVYFEPGQALYIEGGNDTQIVQSAGQVPTKDAVVQLCNGATLVGNSMPVPVNLQDITVTGDEVDYVVQISIVNHIGVKLETYVWTCTGGESGEESKWLNSDFEEMTKEVFFDPGKGLYVEGGNSNQYITIPAPEL